MNFLLSVLIFIFILFVYIHIIDQYKKGQDFEVYETDYIDNSNMQEILNVKQPVIFELNNVEPSIFEYFTLDNISTVNCPYNVNVKDTNDYYKDQDSVDFISLPYHSALSLMRTDTNAHFFTENNFEFVEEGTLIDTKFDILDSLFKPNFTIQKKYDVMFGSKNAGTPLRYHVDYRKFLIVMKGKITVKMTPWKSSKYLHEMKDYDNFEFRSPVNIYNPQTPYKHDVDKLKFLEFDVHNGHVLYIPPYWWYSIKYSNEEDTFILGCTYNSIINRIANIPDIVKYYLQQQNTTKKVTKTLNTQENIENPAENKQINDDTQELI